jgi:hypothetical protein
MRGVVLLALAALAGCGGGPGDEPDGGDANRCTRQTDCEGGSSYRRLCESGYCSRELPDPALTKLVMGLSQQVRNGGPRSFRAFLLHRMTPDGTVVRCSATNTPLAPVAELRDPAKFNLTADPAGMNISVGASQGSVTSFVLHTGANRVLYVEVYPTTIQDVNDGEKPGNEPIRPIGLGCTEDVPYSVDPSEVTITVNVAVPAR